MSTPTCASGKFAPVYSEAARILSLMPPSLNLNPACGYFVNAPLKVAGAMPINR